MTRTDETLSRIIIVPVGLAVGLLIAAPVAGAAVRLFLWAAGV